MKRIIIAFGLVLGVVALANAQGQGNRQAASPAERAERQVKQMQTLNLTDSQKSKLTEIYMAQGASTDSLRKTMTGQQDMQAMRGKMGPIQKEVNAKVLSVLTDDQKKAYAALLADRKENPKQKSRGKN